MFKKIIKWLKNLLKEKCPKCRSLDISIIEKKLIDKHIETKCYDDTDHRIKAMNAHHYRRDYSCENMKCYKVEISVFEVKYKCDKCRYIWNGKFKESKSIGEN